MEPSKKRSLNMDRERCEQPGRHGRRGFGPQKKVSTVMIAIERRRCPRVPFLATVSVQTPNGEVACIALDLSATGMLLLSGVSARGSASRLRVSFALVAADEQISLDAELVRVVRKRRRIAWGVRFVQVPKRLQKVLRRHVYKAICS